MAEEQPRFPTMGSLQEKFEWCVKWRGFEEEYYHETSDGSQPAATTSYIINQSKREVARDLEVEFEEGNYIGEFLKKQQVKAREFLAWLSIDYPELVI